MVHPVRPHPAGIAQLGERQTEDLKVAGSIPAAGISFFFFFFRFFFFPQPFYPNLSIPEPLRPNPLPPSHPDHSFRWRSGPSKNQLRPWNPATLF